MGAMLIRLARPSVDLARRHE